MLNKECIDGYIKNISIQDICLYAQKSFPNEACGFILVNGIIQPSHNIIASIGNPALNTKNAFLIDAESWKIASSRGIAGIYHTHTNGDPEMSIVDVEYLKWKDLFYIIVGIIDHNPVAAKIFWWENEELKDLALNLKEDK
jgi:proteasome lid subunit RPN8/RPN11